MFACQFVTQPENQDTTIIKLSLLFPAHPASFPLLPCKSASHWILLNSLGNSRHSVSLCPWPSVPAVSPLLPPSPKGRILTPEVAWATATWNTSDSCPSKSPGPALGFLSVGPFEGPFPGFPWPSAQNARSPPHTPISLLLSALVKVHAQLAPYP